LVKTFTSISFPQQAQTFFKFLKLFLEIFVFIIYFSPFPKAFLPHGQSRKHIFYLALGTKITSRL